MDPISKARELIQSSEKILAFCGAGLSTESGIPDFRSPGGLWSRYDPKDFYFDRILNNEKAREIYWKMSTEAWDLIRDAKPNQGHLALKRLEDQGRLLCIVTQNIDHLHHKAGNSEDKIIEIHGTAVTVSCLQCGKRLPRDEIHERVKAGVRVPYCDSCGGILKPDTISFGQPMPQDKMQKALQYARMCDLCLVLGSSLVVYPAADIPMEAIRNGAKIIIINRDSTPLDSYADVVINASIGEVLSQIV